MFPDAWDSFLEGLWGWSIKGGGKSFRTPVGPPLSFFLVHGHVHVSDQAGEIQLFFYKFFGGATAGEQHGA